MHIPWSLRMLAQCLCVSAVRKRKTIAAESEVLSAAIDDFRRVELNPRPNYFFIDFEEWQEGKQLECEHEYCGTQ
jgi:hypothetical protein